MLSKELLEETEEQESGNTGDGAYAADLLHRASAEIERLQAIIDKLPKTADGVPAVPGMEVHFDGVSAIIRKVCDSTIRKVCDGGKYGYTVEVEDAKGPWGWAALSSCYSTREAEELQADLTKEQANET